MIKEGLDSMSRYENNSLCILFFQGEIEGLIQLTPLLYFLTILGRCGHKLASNCVEDRSRNAGEILVLLF